MEVCIKKDQKLKHANVLTPQYQDSLCSDVKWYSCQRLCIVNESGQISIMAIHFTEKIFMDSEKCVTPA